MKKFLGIFLFQKRPGEELSRGRKGLFWAWNWVLLMGAALVLGLVSLTLAIGSREWLIFCDILGKPGLLILNLLPPVVLAALLYGLTGRSWLAYLITAVPVAALSIGNFYKLAFRDDPVVAADLLILGEAGKMAGQYRLFYADKVLLMILAAAVSTVLLALFARGRMRGWKSRLAVTAVALAAAGALVPVYNSDKIYSANSNTEHIQIWSATQQYLSRGLLYPFLHSVKDAVTTPPKGYSQKEVNALLAQYEDADIPEEQKVNIVGIMLEAFADFSGYDQIEIAPAVYEYYHELEAESYTGNLVTNIFAGGTINSERAFLSGISSGDHNYRTSTSSYVWYLRSQGYRTSGDHPCYEWFYNRPNINEYLGFEQYRFANYYSQFCEGGVAYDYIFMPQLTQSVLEQMESDQPLFSFSVSYQGHGPYSGETCRWGEVDDFVGNYELDQASRTILANYFGSVQDTQAHLKELVDALRECGEPVVLVLFGDHKPWLGNGASVYSALGIDLSGQDKESYYNYWSTRYLIWANDAAKEALGNDFTGTGPDVSPCFLMNVLFDQCGWAGDAYMQAVYDCWQALPVISTTGRYVTAEGELTTVLNEEQQLLADRFAMLEYDRMKHSAYSELLGKE
ncbi:MAG: LTA synthase family protein [Candidatus Enterenecus sp.]